MLKSLNYGAQFRWTLLICAFFAYIALAGLLPVSAQSITWITPSSSGSACTNLHNCSTPQRTFKAKFSTANNIEDIFLSYKVNGDWVRFYSDNNPKIDSNGMYTTVASLNPDFPNQQVRLEAIVNGSTIVSPVVNLIIDRAAPVISVGNEVPIFAKVPNKLNLALTATDNTSGLNYLEYQIYYTTKGTWYPNFTGIQNKFNYSGQTNINDNVTLNLSKGLLEGYYWVRLIATDLSIASFDSQGNATQFNVGYGHCSVDNNSLCQHFDSTTAPDAFYPVVVDLTPPLINNIKPKLTSQGLELTVTASDNLSWLAKFNYKVNGNSRQNISVDAEQPGFTKTVLIPLSQLSNGTNTLQICLSDSAGNDRCVNTFVDYAGATESPTIITLSWLTQINGRTVRFVPTINPTNIVPKSYKWEFGDGTTSNEVSPTHTYNGNATYNVKLTITTHGNDTVSSTSSVAVTANNVVPQPSSTPTTGQTNPSTTGKPNTTAKPKPSNQIKLATSSTQPNSTNEQGRVLGATTDPKQNEHNNAIFPRDDMFYITMNSPVEGYVEKLINFTVHADSSLGIKQFYWEPESRRQLKTDVANIEYAYSGSGVYNMVVWGRDRRGNLRIANTKVIITGDAPSEYKSSDESTSTKIVYVSAFEKLLEHFSRFWWVCPTSLLLLAIFIVYKMRKPKAQEQNDEDDGTLST